MKPTEKGFFDREICQPVHLRGDDNGILLLHGFTGSAAHMRKLADALHQRGHTVRTINLPGHASTEEDMARSNWQMWLQAAKQAALDMLQEVRTLTVGGLSMGGVLALIVAQQMKVHGCVTYSAPMATQNRLLPLSGLLYPFYPHVSWRAPDERHASLDRNYEYGYKGFPTDKGEDLHRLIRLARDNLFNISCPILCVQSDQDETIWLGSADQILEGVSSDVRRKLQLKGVPHVVTLSRELDAIVEATDGLMRAAREEQER